MLKYKIAHICTEGHCISSFADSDVPSDASFCTLCGSKIIAFCPSCNTAIRGILDINMLNIGVPYTVPGYCHYCGAAYPWIQSRIDAVAEAAADDESISTAETDKLLSLLPSLTSDTSRTTLGAMFVRKVLSNAGDILKETLLDFAARFAVDAAKLILFK